MEILISMIEQLEDMELNTNTLEEKLEKELLETKALSQELEKEWDKASEAEYYIYMDCVTEIVRITSGRIPENIAKIMLKEKRNEVIEIISRCKTVEKI